MSYYIIIRGPLGSGKTTIANKLAKLLGSRYFAVDKILDEHGLTKDKSDGYISQKSFKTVNEIIAPQAEALLEKGTIVIFDGNFYWQSQIEDLLSRLNYQSYVFSLKAPLEVCIARDSARSKTHGRDAAEAVYKKSTKFSYGTVIDATKPLEKVINEILSYLPTSNL